MLHLQWSIRDPGDMAELLHFPVATQPAPGEVIPIAPGVGWLRMPLPFALDHINLWLLEDGPGWSIVDCGFAGEQTTAQSTKLQPGPSSSSHRLMWSSAK